MAGITVVGSLGGGRPRIGRFTVVNADVITQGEMLALSSNEAKKGTTNDTAFIGVALDDVDNTSDGEKVDAICDPLAIYQFFDGTAHLAGATLDLASSGKGLAASSNADFTCIDDNSATEPATFIITPGEHYLHLTG